MHSTETTTLDNHSSAAPSDTNLRQARFRAIVCGFILLILWIFKCILCGGSAFVFYLMLGIPLVIGAFIAGIYLLIQTIKAAGRCVRGTDTLRAFAWTLIPWVLIAATIAADHLLYRGYLAWRRPAVIRQLQSGSLTTADGSPTGEITLRLLDHWTSEDGTIKVYENSDEKLLVGFWTFRGLLSGSWLDCYFSEERPPNSNDFGELEFIKHSRQIAPHWYEVNLQ